MEVIFYTLCIIFLLVSLVKSDGSITNHRNYELFDRNECGLQKVSRPSDEIETRVWGGAYAYLGEYPWIVAVFANPQERDESFAACAGFIISSRYALTTANCCKPKGVELDNMIVRIGEYNLGTNDPETTSTGSQVTHEDIDVDEVVVHERFGQGTTKDNDICLLRVNRPFPVTDYVRPICLPMSDKEINMDLRGSGVVFEVAGWGESNRYPKATTPVLRRIKVPVFDDRVCKFHYTFLGTQLCGGGTTTGTLRNYRRTCEGDAGSPLMWRTKKNGVPRYVAYGMDSFNVAGQCDIQSPSVFVNLKKYVKWILNHVKP